MLTNGADFARAVAVVLDRKCDCGIFRSVRDFRLRRAVRKLATEEVRALLEAGVAPDQHPSMMPILALAAESGADPAQISNEGWSAATWADANFTALAERLIERGAPADSRFAHGYSALHRAARRGEVTAVLGGEAVDALDSSGDTPLSHAIRLRHEAAADALLRAGANPNHSRDAWPLINEAAYQDSRPDEPTRFVARLLVAGADVNPPGYGPLFCAVNQECSA